jgi:hypothetical protein
MIKINRKEVSPLYKGGVTFQAAYKGLHLMWEGIRSCFGSGFWVNNKPWSNVEGWKNN